MKTFKKSIIVATTIAALVVPVAAKAFFPLAGIALLFEASGLTVPIALSAAGHAAIIGLITFAATENNSTSPLASKPITVQIDPDKPLTVPPGWTDDKTPPSTAPLELVCPASTTTRPECQSYGVCKYTLTTSYADNGAGRCAVTLTVSEVDFVPNQYGVQPGSFSGGTVDKIPACPSGYTGTQTCNLQSPGDVKKPEKSKDEIQRVGNTFQRDPMQNPADNNPALVQEAPNRISYTDAATGEKVTIELNSSTGAAKVTQTVPNYGNITTSQQVTTISGGSNGTGAGASITGQFTATYSGVGDQMGDTPISGWYGSGSGGGGSGGGSSLCEGCATEETLSNIKDVLEGEGAGAESAGEGLAEGFAGTQNGVFSSLGGVMSDMVANSGLLQAYTEKVLPASPWDMAVGGVSSNCEFGFQLLGKTYYLSVCEAQPYLHNAIAFILFFLTAVGVFNLVTERPEGGD